MSPRNRRRSMCVIEAITSKDQRDIHNNKRCISNERRETRWIHAHFCVSQCHMAISDVIFPVNHVSQRCIHVFACSMWSGT